MGVRILFSWAIDANPREVAQAELGGIEPRVLPRHDYGRRDAEYREGACNRLELDGFGPGPDDQPYVSGTQPSP
jgi:hypothetical protein